jgi:YidC/Oxa1 family membrane protein insertase
MFNTFLYQPILNTLVFFTNVFQGNFGFAIIVLTILIRAALIPLSLPSMKSAQKIKLLKPELDKLKKKHPKDKKALQQEQLKLYQQHGVNPAAGCLPTIAQFAILIALYRVFIDFINKGSIDSMTVNMKFLWLDLSKPDPLYILPILAVVSQFILSKMIMGGREHHTTKDLTKTKKHNQKKDKKQEESTLEMGESIQQQMLYIMPVMTGLIALRFPSGLALYWVITTVFSTVQQYFVSGPGELKTLYEKIKR